MRPDPGNNEGGLGGTPLPFGKKSGARGVSWGWGGLIPLRAEVVGVTLTHPLFREHWKMTHRRQLLRRIWGFFSKFTLVARVHFTRTAARPDAGGGSQTGKGGGGSERNPPTF